MRSKMAITFSRTSASVGVGLRLRLDCRNARLFGSRRERNLGRIGRKLALCAPLAGEGRMGRTVAQRIALPGETAWEEREKSRARR